jgi:hypothetical protein
MMPAKVYEDVQGEDLKYLIHCPGCGCLHFFDKRWSYSGNAERPTFSPSLVVKDGATVCHMFVTEGKIHFLNDSTHALAGLTVDLPDW